MFYRTARMLESGMKPVYVFDGARPPRPPSCRQPALPRAPLASPALSRVRRRRNSTPRRPPTAAPARPAIEQASRRR